MDGGAYGAGRAGAPFNPVTYIKKPEVIVRLVSLVRLSIMLCRFQLNRYSYKLYSFVPMK